MGLWFCQFLLQIITFHIFFLFCGFVMVPPAGRGPRGADGDTCTVGKLLEILSEVLIWGIIPLKNALANLWTVEKDANL